MTDGILLVDKPSGPTSHDVVHRIRRVIGEGRVGHAGTLDPGATGLLVILVGKATRLNRFIAMLPKTYTATVLFGWESSTDDMFGEPTTERTEAWRQFTQDAIDAALEQVRSSETQLPPLVSAKKIGGKRAYQLARQGETPDLAPAKVTIHRLSAEPWSNDSPELMIEVSCSSGTYIRSIARDLGRLLGGGAHLGGLRRTAIGPWQVERALKFDDGLADTIPALWHPMSEAVEHLPRIDLHAEDARRFTQGQKLKAGATATPVAVFAGNELLGVADVEEGLLKPDVVLAA